MKKWLLSLLYTALALAPIVALADYTATQGAGTTVLAFVCASTKVCPAQVLIDSTGAEKIGSKTSANSIPVVVASDQGAIPHTIASGGVASGAYAAGSLATGAGVDGWNLTEGAKGDTVCGSDTGSCSLLALIKRLNTLVDAPPPLGTSAGWTPLLLNALSTTVKPIKASPGQLGLLHCWNPNATVEYVQVFNVASGSVTLGTTVPVQSFGIPPTNATGYTLSLQGLQFGTAISVAATTTATGLTAPGTALDCNAGYN
jgi:hypothetical protein